MSRGTPVLFSRFARSFPIAPRSRFALPSARHPLANPLLQDRRRLERHRDGGAGWERGTLSLPLNGKAGVSANMALAMGAIA